MGRRHRGGRGSRGRGILRAWPRFGGWNPLKVLAIVGGVVAGGVIAVTLVGLLMLILTVIGFATAGVSWLLTYGWIIAAFLIYRAIRSRQSQDEYAYEYDDDEWKHDEHEREREYQRRVEELKECAPAPRPDTRPKRQAQQTAAPAALAILSGLALALGANVALSGLQLPPVANTLLPPLTGALAGAGAYAALKRWVMPPVDGEKPPAKQVRAQIGRIQRKARDLRREAVKAGGVFNGLDAQADRLAREAQELGQRLFDLRRIARDVRREFGNPAQPDGVPRDASAPQVQAALRKAQEAQKRLDDLLSRNRAAQHQCLTQIERIEDLLDVARLEVACPDEALPADRGREELVQEVETELEAARRALEEVRRQSEMA